MRRLARLCPERLRARIRLLGASALPLAPLKRVARPIQRVSLPSGMSPAVPTA